MTDKTAARAKAEEAENKLDYAAGWVEATSYQQGVAIEHNRSVIEAALLEAEHERIVAREEADMLRDWYKRAARERDEAASEVVRWRKATGHDNPEGFAEMMRKEREGQ